jgi:23S rRNA pseudouridine955/2504/2580 synthase
VERLKEMIIFETDHVIVINKDNGVPSQMGTGLSVDNKSEVAVDKMLNAYCPEGKLIHRLDRKTSGLMVLAKTADMAAFLGL